MSKVKQRPQPRGSQHWMQVLANDRADVLNAHIASAVGLSPTEAIEWRSPLCADDYAEYRDHDFLDRLGVTLKERSLDSFWPSGGPQWDALGRTAGGKIFLVEAKAHVGELASGGTQAASGSRDRIEAALAATQRHLGVPDSTDWAGRYYQYTNRLAHLYLLRELNKIDAWLVFLYFLNDVDMKGPASREEWLTAIDTAHRTLGLEQGTPDGVIDVFLDVRDLA